jgi:hypothetical protein
LLLETHFFPFLILDFRVHPVKFKNDPLIFYFFTIGHCCFDYYLFYLR